MTTYIDTHHKVTYKIGHPADRFSGETNDCTVRALVNAFEIPYSIAHYELAKRAGRKERKGASFYGFIRSYIPFGKVSGLMFGKKVTIFEPPKMIIRTFVQKNPVGIFIVQHRGHVFTVRDGVIYDSFATKVTRRVSCYWKVEDPNSNPSPVPLDPAPKTRKAYAPRTGKSQKNQVMELYHQGKTVQEIVDLTGIQKPNVQCYISKNKNK